MLSNSVLNSLFLKKIRAVHVLGKTKDHAPNSVTLRKTVKSCFGEAIFPLAFVCSQASVK